MRFSNVLLAIVNVVTSLIGLALLGGGIWAAVQKGGHYRECMKAFQWPLIIAGAFILLVSLSGLWGAVARARWFIGLYIGVIAVLILALIAVTVLGIVMWKKGGGHPVAGHGFKEYELQDYSTWLQREVTTKAGNWKKIRQCLLDAKVCKSVAKSKSIAELDSMSAIESGCCKPPTACNLTYVRGIEWSSEKGSNTTTNGDCKLWSNDTSTLCFDCDSCKAGVLQNVKDDWKQIAIIDAALVVFLLLVFSIGYWAFHQSDDDDDDYDDNVGKYPRHSGGAFYVQKA